VRDSLTTAGGTPALAWRATTIARVEAAQV
jgi:hypothetical protein